MADENTTLTDEQLEEVKTALETLDSEGPNDIQDAIGLEY